MTLSDLEKKTGKGVMMRSCWKCNPAHKHLKRANYILWCFECGELYYKGKILNEESLTKMIKNEEK